MNRETTQIFQHVCPRNCPSSCTMFSYVKNNQIKHITGDSAHPYTNGKLCQKGFSYIEQNDHPDRLKYPYYQKVKGSGKFQRITWEKAYELITNELLNINNQYKTFLPLALYKGTGNVGIHHHVIDKFFSSLNETTRIIATTTLLKQSHPFDNMLTNDFRDPTMIVNASAIVIWGANPAVSNIHLIPFIIKAKMKGTKIVVIDPLFTKTAQLADLFIQLRPDTDSKLVHIILKRLIETKKYDDAFIKQYTSGFDSLAHMLEERDTGHAAKQCDIPAEALEQLLALLLDAKTVAYIVGTGIQKHAAGAKHMRAIETLAVVRGDIGKKSGGLFFPYRDSTLFTNPKANNDNRLIYQDELSYTSLKEQFPIEMLWISCGNPLLQEIHPDAFKKFMTTVPFIVTVDRFMTPTAQMSNLVLPTTSHFEEIDIIVNHWHQRMALNQAAVAPYFESKSEWTIMTELSAMLKEQTSITLDFPIYRSEEDYLNAQFNDQVLARYGVKNLSDLKGDSTTAPYSGNQGPGLKPGQYSFALPKEARHEQDSLPVQMEEPAKNYPFWLITPHHPYALNSQFHYLNLSDENEAFVGINPTVAATLGIFDGEIMRVYNEQDAIEIKAVHSQRVPNDIVMIYQGWYPYSYMTINHLISESTLVSGESESPYQRCAFYDTFVNVEKL